VTTPVLRIRPATASDLSSVLTLLAAVDLPVAGIDAQLCGFAVATRNEEIVGCAAIERHGDTGLLRSVAVHPLERGRATGGALVRHCIAEARRAKLSSLVLLTTTAEHFFPRFGFHTIPRDTAPAPVRNSVEFREACPASATTMQLHLDAVVACRTAQRGDAAGIAAIYNAGIRSRLATFETRERIAEEVATWVDDEQHPTLVAECKGQVVGWVAASAYRPRECYAGIAEFAVYVDPGHQGKGIGGALMSAFIPALEEQGFWKVLSRIFPENTASLALCRRHGFREVGRYQRHAQLDGLWRDVVIVERLLGGAAPS
jgi:phosphinothricin acetyltransferase